MARLNKDGSEVARAFGLRALTDVTGFGLLGHLTEMCRASAVSAELWWDRLPILPGAADLVRAGIVPGGTKRNLEFVVEWTHFDALLAGWQQLLVADAQTSGGLMLAVPPELVDEVVFALGERGALAASVIGMALDPDPGEPLLRVRASVGQGPGERP
jgi:selenide,water dikinase